MGPFALDNLTSLKYVAFVICFLLPILVPGPRVLADAASAADNATFGGIGAIKLLLYIFFFFAQLLLRPKGILCYGRHTQNPPHLNEAQLEPTPREDALTIITLASSTRPGRPHVKVYSLYSSLLLFQHYFKCYFPYLRIDK